MTETLEPMADEVNQLELAQQLLAQAKEQGIELMGPNGLLGQLTKNVLETALDAEMTEHLGYEKNDPAGRGSGNSLGRHQIEDGAHRDRPGRDRRPAGHRLELRTEDRAQTATAADRHRRDRALAQRQRIDHRRDLGTLSGYLRSVGVEGHHLPDHRQGARGDDRMAEPAPRSGVSGGVHRRHPRQDPRRSGHQPTDLRRDRGDRQR